jgi:DNA polymerase I-like protein with 3'-5' exonuclease and polymerase domains
MCDNGYVDKQELQVGDLKPAMNVTLIQDSSGLERVRDFFGRVKTFGFDTETNVVDTFVTRKIRTIQVGDRNEQYVIDLLPFAASSAALYDGQGWNQTPKWSESIVDTLRPILESRDYLKVGANLQFDYEVMRWCLGVRPWNFYDVMLAEKVIYAGKVNFFQKDFWGLKDMAWRYCRLVMSKEEQSGFDLETPLTESQVLYAGLDTRVPLAVMSGQAAAIDKPGLRTTVDIERNAIPAFGDMKLNGILLSKEKWFDLHEKTLFKHEENIKQLDTYFMSAVGPKQAPSVEVDFLERRWRDEKDKDQRAEYRKQYQAGAKLLRDWRDNGPTYEGAACINYGSTKQLMAAMLTMGFTATKLPDTSDRTLEKLSSHAVIKALQAYRETAKKLTTYGTEFYTKNVNEFTGRIHSNINQLGAATGRTTSSAPNLQNIPRGSAYRAAFVARPGYKFVTVDMAGAELRILAEESGEPLWVEAFAKGWDVHSVGAEMIFGQAWKDAAEPTCAYYFTADHQKCGCKKHKQLRDQIKAINFGIAYGMEAGKLSDGLGITKKEAQALLDNYRGTFKKVTAYLKESGDKSKLQLAAYTLAGRRRLFERPTWERAEELARKRATEDGKNPDLVGSGDKGRAYNGMYGSIEREGKNSPIQGFNADVLKLAMGCGFDAEGVGFMWHRLWSDFKAEVVLEVHDEVDVEVEESRAEECKVFIGECFTRAAAMFMKSVKMDYDGSVGDCWTK